MVSLDSRVRTVSASSRNYAAAVTKLCQCCNANNMNNDFERNIMVVHAFVLRAHVFFVGHSVSVWDRVL